MHPTEVARKHKSPQALIHSQQNQHSITTQTGTCTFRVVSKSNLFLNTMGYFCLLFVWLLANTHCWMPESVYTSVLVHRFICPMIRIAALFSLINAHTNLVNNMLVLAQSCMHCAMLDGCERVCVTMHTHTYAPQQVEVARCLKQARK